MNPGGGMVVMRLQNDNGVKPKPINPRELPEFRYPPLVLGEVLPGALIDLFLQVGFIALLLAAAFRAFLRYDLR